LTYDGTDFGTGDSNQKISQDPVSKGSGQRSQKRLQRDDDPKLVARQPNAGDPDHTVIIVVALTIAILCGLFAFFWLRRRRQREDIDQRE